MSGSRNAIAPETAHLPLFIAPDTWPAANGAEGQCDCAGGACVPAASITPAADCGIDDPGRAFQLTEGSFEIDVTAAHVVLHSASACGPVVVHRSIIPALHYLEAPQPISQIPSISSEWHKDQMHDLFDTLIRLGFLQSTTAAVTPEHLVENTTSLVAWLHVTDRCNLRCSYCYLPHTHADMSAETGRAAINATFRSALAHSYPAVKLKYAGGEPLLHFPLIVKLHRYADRLAEQHSLKLDGVVLSNGTLLTPEIVEMMQSLDLRLMISLDGLGKYHDCQRHFADGRGSFNAVARAVDLALSLGLVPDISITVSRRNADGLPELMAWVLERDLPFSLNFYRENELSVSNTDLRLEEDCITKGMLAAYKVIEANLPRRSLLALLADRANLSAPHLRTCSVGRSYLVFDPQGRVAKCQMDIGHTITDTNNPDPLATVRESTVGIHNLEVDKKSGCCDCQWRYWCAGGCPLMTYRATGRYDAKSPNCNIYHALYPEVVRLEGLRLLKYADGRGHVSFSKKPSRPSSPSNIISASRSSNPAPSVRGTASG